MASVAKILLRTGVKVGLKAREQWRATREAFHQGLRGEPARGPSSPRLDELYARLELPSGAGLDEVEAAYRRLLRLYHPDRFAADPDRFRRATELTQKLNEARAELRRHLGADRR